MEDTLSLLQLNEYIRRVIALNFESPLWVKAELSQVKQSRGHYYLDLIQKDDNSDKVVAQISAVVWANTFWFLRKKLGNVLFDILQDGMELRLKINVDFHERYGLKLVVEDLDPSFSMGQLEIARRKILEDLQKNGLLDRNAQLRLPLVMQRLAVISSEKAAGFQDFIKQLEENPYGYDFRYSLYETAVQGVRVEKDIVGALGEIDAAKNEFDCVIIVRGGGARIDLAAFDNYAIGEAIARLSLPVITGIGHDIDQTVTDIVAHSFCKTPTAVADFLIEHNAGFENQLLHWEQSLYRLGGIYLEEQRAGLARFFHWLQLIPQNRLTSRKKTLASQSRSLVQLGKSQMREQKRSILHIERILQSLDPKNTLQRGYSITEDEEGNILTSIKNLTSENIRTRLFDGIIDSRVLKKRDNE